MAFEDDLRLWPAEPAAGGTLEQAMSLHWDRLAAHAPTACPVCDGEMRPQYAAGAGVVGGRCTSCGSTLA